MRRGLLLTTIAAASLLLLAACNGGDGEGDTEGTSEATATESATTGTATEPAATSTNAPRPTPTFPPVTDPLPVTVTPAYEGVVLERPVEVLSYPLGSYEIAIADQGGMVYGVREGQSFEILDLTDRVLTGGNEEGLLSVALDPQFSTNRNVWIYYSADEPKRTVLARFTANEDGTIDRSSELVVLEQEQPAANHNGGSIRFGSDRMLYLGLGDGDGLGAVACGEQIELGLRPLHVGLGNDHVAGEGGAQRFELGLCAAYLRRGRIDIRYQGAALQVFEASQRRVVGVGCLLELHRFGQHAHV